MPENNDTSVEARNRGGLPSYTAQDYITRGKALLASGNALGAHAMFNFALTSAEDDSEILALLASSSLGLGANSLAESYANAAMSRIGNLADGLGSLATQVINVSRLRRGLDCDTLRLDELTEDPLERAILRGLAHVERSEFEEGLYELACATSDDFDDKRARNHFVLALQKFQGDGERFDEFVDALDLKSYTQENSSPEHKASEVVDIIIPVHGAVDELLSCVSSILRWRSPLMRKIIIVDDASSPDERQRLEVLASDVEDVQLIVNRENVGFTRSIMVGVRESRTPYALFLNSDTVVTAGWLEGLFFAINRRDRTALSGPLTNNGYYQTVDLSEEASRALRENLDWFAAKTMAERTHTTPVVPLLSGFCLLVRRDAFDEVNGLDEDAFPWGYWETQDLCLRLKDAGYSSVIADDVFVYHSGSKSVSSARKRGLISTGLRIIYERYSNLRFQVAEALSAIEPVVIANKHRITNFCSARNEGSRRLQGAEDGVRCELRLIKGDICVDAKDEVCLFVAHAPLGRVPDFTKRYLESLRKNGFLVFLCLATDTIHMPVDKDLTNLSEAVVVRSNAGYDFGAWSDLLRLFPEVWNSRRLLFANDSVIGPIFPMDKLISEIRSSNAGFFALTDSTFGSYHAQSYFFGWSKANLGHAKLRSFWSGVANEQEKVSVIDKYERSILGLSEHLPDSRVQILFGIQEVLGVSPSSVQGVSMAHHAWRAAVNSGLPFVKAQLLRESMLYGIGKVESSGDSLLVGLGVDLNAVNCHIDFININRMCVSNFLSSASLYDAT